MSNPAEPAARPHLLAAADHFLARLRAWWRHHNELGTFDRNELERIAGEFGLSARDLEELEARGPHAADLLHERMKVLGIARDDVERLSHGLMRDLERTCSCCNDKGVCGGDLARRPDDPTWKAYCPNAVSLDSIKRTKGRFA